MGKKTYKTGRRVLEIEGKRKTMRVTYNAEVALRYRSIFFLLPVLCSPPSYLFDLFPPPLAFPPFPR